MRERQATSLRRCVAKSAEVGGGVSRLQGGWMRQVGCGCDCDGDCDQSLTLCPCRPVESSTPSRPESEGEGEGERSEADRPMWGWDDCCKVI